MPRSVRLRVVPFGVNVVGYVTGNLGLGVATRNTINSLKAGGVRVAATDLDPGLNRAGHDTAHKVMHRANPYRTPYLVTLYHVNPIELALQLQVKPGLSRHDRVAAIVPFWELETLPPGWSDVLAAMDIILTPTAFIRTAVQRELPDALCVDYPQTVYVEEQPPDRARWHMDQDKTVFVTSFDVASALERKNPHGVVDAFQLAFEGRRDVQLFLKANSVEGVPDVDGRWHDLARRARGDQRITLITESMPYRDVLSLYASADCLVSLHRSEGLGLSMMEAMTLGKPTIATAWSGNMDFMTPENSRLVDFSFVPVSSGHPSYRDAAAAGARWADASLVDAARHMREIADDPQAAKALGRRAREDMRVRRSGVGGELVCRLREATASDSEVWAAHPQRRRKMLALAKGAELRVWKARAHLAPAPMRSVLGSAYRFGRRAIHH